VMALIAAIGYVVDRGIFGPVENRTRAKWGLAPA
jgi:hypothetical protein